MEKQKVDDHCIRHEGRYKKMPPCEKSGIIGDALIAALEG